MTSFNKDHAEYEYSKAMKVKYDKPRYRITITPPYLFWEVQYIWVLKHWGKERVKAACDGGYMHKFTDYHNILYYRID